jgi:hypothetical protein
MAPETSTSTTQAAPGLALRFRMLRPTRAFATYEGLPSDWYLRLTGEGTKVIRGERKAQAALPIKP